VGRLAGWRGATVVFVIFGGIGLVFLFGAGLLGLNAQTTARAWLASAHGPWALPASVAAFAILAFLGVPQFVLIAAAVAAFGPGLGAVYSWVGTVVSALVGFGLGRLWGAYWVDRIAMPSLIRFLGLIARNGLLASLAVRLAPFAPFVAVNLAAGASPIGLSDFTIGTALGIVPKILLTAFAGAAIVHSLAGGGLIQIALLILAAGLWVGSGLLAGRWLRR
jgi:uncharacterized membrane protein YdjX (TVP38/TMEM64 family)